MSRRSRVTALLLATAALAFGALVGIGCGDDDDEVTLPSISVEETTGTTVPTETTQQTEGATTPNEPGTGGTGSGNFDPDQEDSATNDKPPKPGSPEAAFEQACEQNPAACQ